ncbi:MAG: hypothetical protein WBO92_02850 [Candidatus Moraniibacteriota bacterium]
MFTPLFRLLALLIMTLGLACIIRPQQFPMDVNLYIIWSLLGFIVAVIGSTMLLCIPMRKDTEWRKRFGFTD